MESVTISEIFYTQTHHIGITPDNPAGTHTVTKSYLREEYNIEDKTPYKEAVANARFWKYVDYARSEENFKKDYEREVAKVFIDEQRGGAGRNISQASWLKKMDAANKKMADLSAALWNRYH